MARVFHTPHSGTGVDHQRGPRERWVVIFYMGSFETVSPVWLLPTPLQDRGTAGDTVTFCKEAFTIYPHFVREDIGLSPNHSPCHDQNTTK